jgi:hypothetical protein
VGLVVYINGKVICISIEEIFILNQNVDDAIKLKCIVIKVNIILLKYS